MCKSLDKKMIQLNSTLHNNKTASGQNLEFQKAGTLGSETWYHKQRLCIADQPQTSLVQVKSSLNR